MMHHDLHLKSRRQWLQQTGLGFGSLALAGMCAEKASADLLAPRAPHRDGPAKRVIMLFMEGGQSQMDLFDPKPELRNIDGQLVDKKNGNGLRYKGSPVKFRACGQSGLELGSVWQSLAEHADRLCLIRSMTTDTNNHSNAMLAMHTGSQNFVRPSVGAWVAYGLGTDSKSLPGFVTLRPARAHGSRVYSNAFLPAIYQGTPLGSDGVPARELSMADLQNARWSAQAQRHMLDFTQARNRELLATGGSTPEMEGLIQSYERAFRLQFEATNLFDLSNESRHVLDLYGVDQTETDDFGRMCILARRFAEAGVRFIQLNHPGWDHHGNIDASLPNTCRAVDQPMAALLTDLAQRGLLDDTLVVSSSEFGRTATAEGSFETAGRNHNSKAFTVWMAGGGARGGMTYGATDPLGVEAVEKKAEKKAEAEPKQKPKAPKTSTARRKTPKRRTAAKVDKDAPPDVQPLLATLKNVRDEVEKILDDLKAQ